MWQIGPWPAWVVFGALSLHFLLGFLVAWSLCWLTLTILRYFGGEDGLSTRVFLLGLALSGSAASHVLEDYWVNLF